MKWRMAIVTTTGWKRHQLDHRDGNEEIGILFPSNQRQHRTLYIQKNVLPYALCYLLCPVSAALSSILPDGFDLHPEPYTLNPKTRAGVCDAGGGRDDEQATREGP